MYMYPTTLVFPVIGQPVQKMLLGMKKVRFGRGKYNGFGGKADEGESMRAAAVRELREESGLTAREEDLEFVGRLWFYFPAKPEWDHSGDIYFLRSWEGQPVESEEMQPAWFDAVKIPYEEMWEDDICWLPQVLAGEKIFADVIFAEDNEGMAEFRLRAAEPE